MLLLAAVDFALVRLSEQRSHGLRAWAAGLRFAGSHLRLTLGLWAATALLLGAAVAVFVGLRELTSAGSAGLPTVLAVGIAVVLQQLFMLTRTWLRVGLLGAEQHAFAQAYAVAAAAPEEARPAWEGAAIDEPRHQ